MTLKQLLKPKKTIISLIAILLFLLSFHVIAANKTVVLLPLKLYADPGKAYLGQGIKTMLASRMSGEGLDVISSDSVLSEADKQGVTSEQRAEELARLLKANYAVFGSVTSLGASYSLDLSFLDLTKDKPAVTKVSEAATEDQLIPKLSDIVYDFRAIAAGLDIRKQVSAGASGEKEVKGLFFKRTSDSHAFSPTGRASVKAGVMSLDVGDLDGDGQSEIVVLSRDALMVYDRKEKSLALKDTFRAAMGEEFLKVNVADVDGNGKAEIYLASFYGSRAQSSILEYVTEMVPRLKSPVSSIFLYRASRLCSKLKSVSVMGSSLSACLISIQIIGENLLPVKYANISMDHGLKARSWSGRENSPENSIVRMDISAFSVTRAEANLRCYSKTRALTGSSKALSGR